MYALLPSLCFQRAHFFFFGEQNHRTNKIVTRAGKNSEEHIDIEGRERKREYRNKKEKQVRMN